MTVGGSTMAGGSGMAGLDVALVWGTRSGFRLVGACTVGHMGRAQVAGTPQL